MRFPFPALAAAGALFTLAPAAMATDYYVKEGSTGNGTSWANAYGYLDQALAVAGPTDHILVHEGTYTPRNCGTGRNRTFCVLAGASMHGGFETSVIWGDPDGSFADTLLNGEVDLPATSDNLYNVVTVDGNGAGLSNLATIDGFKIKYGYADGTGTDGEGGAIRAFDSELLLHHLIIRDNFAESGGGLHFHGGTGATRAVLEWSLTRVRDNLATDEGGGAFLRNTDDSALGNIKFRDNGGSVARGGGLFVGPEVGSLAVTQTIFHDNSAGTGGAIYIADASVSGSGGSVWTNNTVAFNTATTDGAGMYIADLNSGVLHPEVYNSIHYFNPEVANDENITLALTAGVIVDYSDIGCTMAQCGTAWPSPGSPPNPNTNINVDPLFRNNSARNFRLKSLGAASVISKCLDAGDDCRVPLDRLDIDEDNNFIEKLPLDFEKIDADTGTASLRFEDVENAPDTGNDCTSTLPDTNDPVDVIVDMGAYESSDTGVGGPGEGDK